MSDIWSSCLGVFFLQLANDLRDFNFIQEFHARIAEIRDLTRHLTNEADGVYEVMKDAKKKPHQDRRSTNASETSGLPWAG